jgi:hypothetical protein
VVEIEVESLQDIPQILGERIRGSTASRARQAW